MAKFVKKLQKVKTDKDYVIEAIKDYIVKFSKNKVNSNIFTSLSLGDNLKELLYQNRLHTFGKNKITWDEFNTKCHEMFTIRYKFDKCTSYDITLFKMDGLYKTVEYVVLYKKFVRVKTANRNVYDTEVTEYKAFSMRKIYHDKTWENLF